MVFLIIDTISTEKPATITNEVMPKTGFLPVGSLGEGTSLLKKLNTSFFIVKTSSSVKNIPLSDILYFESNKRVLIVHTKNDEYSFYGKLDQVEKELDGKDFIRTHQSYFVNARKIKSVSKDSAELQNGEILPVSKSKASAVKNAYLWAKR